MRSHQGKKYSLREKWLIGLLITCLLCLAGALIAWKIQLVPLATDVGNVGEWIGALATVGGFAAAVYTLQKNAADARKHEEVDQRAEAARVAVAWDMTVEDLGSVEVPGTEEVERLWRHKVRIRNSGSSPVTHAYLWLNHMVHGTWRWEQRNSVVVCNTLLPGAERVVDYDINWGMDMVSAERASGIALGEMTGFGFRDVHGQCWMNQDGELRKVRSEEAYAMDA